MSPDLFKEGAGVSFSKHHHYKRLLSCMASYYNSGLRLGCQDAAFAPNATDDS